MAVLDELPGVEVSIEVDGEPLKEYEDADREQAAETVVRYVEATSEAAFKIKFAVKNEAKTFLGDRLAFRVYIDGNFADAPRLKRPGSYGAHKTKYSLGFRKSDNESWSYEFNRLETGMLIDPKLPRIVADMV